MTKSFEERVIGLLRDKHIYTQGRCDSDVFVVIPIFDVADALLALVRERDNHQQGGSRE